MDIVFLVNNVILLLCYDNGLKFDGVLDESSVLVVVSEVEVVDEKF